jgi:CheY-like chemotaxis protein
MSDMVLIVEDDMALWYVYKYALRHLKSELVFARNGQTALEILDTKTPKLVILDMRLPIVSGLELLNHFQRVLRLANTPIIVASSMKEYRPLAPNGAFLHKPIKPETIKRMVDTVLALAE